MNWAKQLMPVSLAAQFDPALLDRAGPRTARDWIVDVLGFLVAVAFGVLIVLQGLHDSVHPLTGSQLGIDILCGAICCLSLWWRHRWPLGVALVCVLLGVFLGVRDHRWDPRAVLPGRAPQRPAGALRRRAVGSTVHRLRDLQRTDRRTGGAAPGPRDGARGHSLGMFVRARRQLLHTLRERALRAEADQLLQADNARTAERTRIAREMHDVLAHRISLIALHAGGLEVRPDLPTEKVRETAVLLRSTARQALEELRDVIGVLREEPGHDVAPEAPQPTLADIPRLVEETRQTGAKIDFEMRVDRADTAPIALGRDAYRIVQESLTNIGKHARGTAGRVQVRGAAGSGLHVSVRNPLPVHAHAGPTLPGSGAGLLGLQERVTLAGGTLVHGPDGSGDFVVDAELRW